MVLAKMEHVREPFNNNKHCPVFGNHIDNVFFKWGMAYVQGYQLNMALLLCYPVKSVLSSVCYCTFTLEKSLF